MRVHPVTLLFEDITPEEQREMRAWAEDLILRGRLPPQHPAWVTEWMRAGGYTDQQMRMLCSTALPQRVLLSLLQARDR